MCEYSQRVENNNMGVVLTDAGHEGHQKVGGEVAAVAVWGCCRYLIL